MTRMSGADLSFVTSGKAPPESQPSSRTGENPPYGMIGGIVETSASFEARSAPRSYPTEARHTRRPNSRIAPIGSAKRILMSGARFSADEALRIGLVQEICEPESIERSLSETVASLLQSAPGAVATIKAQVARLRHQPPTLELLAELQRGFDAAKDSAEAKEGRAAMREKRPPNWAVKPVG